jgi:hypothetical protein
VESYGSRSMLVSEMDRYPPLPYYTYRYEGSKSIPMAGDSMFDLDTQPQQVGHGSHRCAAAPCKAVEEIASRSTDWKNIVMHSVLAGQILEATQDLNHLSNDHRVLEPSQSDTNLT